MNFADPMDDPMTGQTQFPQQIQQVIEQINNLYQEIDYQENDIEDQLFHQLKLKKRSRQTFNRLKQEIEEIILGKLEQLVSLLQKLVQMQTDAIIKLNNQQANLLQLLISRIRQNLKGKKDSLQKLLIQINQNLAQQALQQEESDKLEGDTNIQTERQRENEQLLEHEITIAQHEEELDKDEKHIKDIHKDVNEIMDIIDTISVEVQKQGETIDRIEDTVNAADQDMDDGLEKLLKADKQQKLSKKARCIVAICSGIVAALIVIIIIAVFV